jgi:hypothetical protein
MHVPPTDPRDRSTPDRLTWQNVLTAYALLAGVFLLIWAISYPIAAAATLALSLCLAVAVRRARAAFRCVAQCDGVTTDLVGNVRVTVIWTHAGGQSVPEADGGTASSPSCC